MNQLGYHEMGNIWNICNQAAIFTCAVHWDAIFHPETCIKKQCPGSPKTISRISPLKLVIMNPTKTMVPSLKRTANAPPLKMWMGLEYYMAVSS